MGGSQANSEMDLAFNYNGITRLIGVENIGGWSFKSNFETVLPKEISIPGPMRLFSLELAGQVSWLLPLALLSLVGLLAMTWKENSPRKSLILLYGIWLITGYLFFSASTFYHRLYLVMLAPPIAGLAGMGLSVFWDAYLKAGWEKWILPFVILASAAVACAILWPYLLLYPSWDIWLIFIVGGLSLFAVVNLLNPLVDNLPLEFSSARLALIIAALGLVIPQLVWAGITVSEGEYTNAPFAGPDLIGWKQYRPSDMMRNFQGLVNYLEQHHSTERFLMGSLTEDPTEYVILLSGQPAMAMGGFLGSDPILTPDSLSRLVGSGEIRYFYIVEPYSTGTRLDLIAWFRRNCIQPFDGDRSWIYGLDNILYDCKPNN